MEDVPTLGELHKKITEHEKFDQLLNKHYARNKHLTCIKDIHEDVHSLKN